MNKELFVSATPHETKVGITEDDQLAEIYLERENEYTLAGSIYKGRVTRVLPGMQSAFVDIGLERDAFLYVSDFMDLEQQDEDLDEAIPANRPALESRPRGMEAESPSEGSLSHAGGASAEAEEPASGASGNTTGGGRDFRGRRRRRGRRGEVPTEPRTDVGTSQDPRKGPSQGPNQGPSQETTASAAAAVPVAPGRIHGSSARRRRPPASAATTITDHPPGINPSSFLANRSQSISARVWARAKDWVGVTPRATCEVTREARPVLFRPRAQPLRNRRCLPRSLPTFPTMNRSLPR